MKRIYKIGVAVEQLINVIFLPLNDQTNSNETFSGRCYRQNWEKSEKWINKLFSPFEKNHCEKSYLRDVKRAKQLLEEDFL